MTRRLIPPPKPAVFPQAPQHPRGDLPTRRKLVQASCRPARTQRLADSCAGNTI